MPIPRPTYGPPPFEPELPPGVDLSQYDPNTVDNVKKAYAPPPPMRQWAPPKPPTILTQGQLPTQLQGIVDPNVYNQFSQPQLDQYAQQYDAMNPRPNSVFWQEDEWLRNILDERWLSHDEGMHRRLLAIPYSAMKAYLFFEAQGNDPVMFNDQQMTGIQAANMVMQKAQEARQQKWQYARQQKLQKQQQHHQEQTAPLPFRVTPRFTSVV